MQLQFTLAPTDRQKNDYFRIRETCFRDDLQLAGFDGREDAWDRCSHLLVALDGNRCIGGVRISGSVAVKDEGQPTIPLEAHGAQVPQLLPELATGGGPYCQPTRLAIVRDYRQPRVLNAFTTAIATQSAALGFSHCIAVAGMARSRFYRRIFHACGYGYRIYDNLAVPAEPGFTDLPHILSVGFLAPASTNRGTDWPARAA